MIKLNMGKYEEKAAKMLTKGLITSSMGLPPGSDKAAKWAGKYAKNKVKSEIDKKNPFKR